LIPALLAAALSLLLIDNFSYTVFQFGIVSSQGTLRAGYTSVQITYSYYIDAYDVNLQEGFDEVNGRSLGEEGIFPLARKIHWEDAGYFLPQLFARIFDRLLHVFFIREMPDSYHEVIRPVDPNWISKSSDKARMGKLGRVLRDAKNPMFVHVHLIDPTGRCSTPAPAYSLRRKSRTGSGCGISSTTRSWTSTHTPACSSSI
jgi:hypothetical protein